MQLFNFFAAAVTLAPFTAASYSPRFTGSYVKRSELQRCASDQPPAAFAEHVAKVAGNDNTYSRTQAEIDGISKCHRTIKIPTYLHASVPSNASDSFASEAVMKKQFEVLNKAYAPHDIVFVLKEITRTKQDNITEFNPTEDSKGIIGSDNPALEEYWKETRTGGYNTLHIYFYNTMVPDSLLGKAVFPDPSRSEDEKWLDGVHCHGGSLPGGPLEPYNLGATAVHEVGHWLGLLHVFGEDCESAGDFVADTPVQSMQASGCPIGQDSCPGKPGVDNIHNYMDYSDDACLE